MSVPVTKAQRVRAVLSTLSGAECTARELTRRLGLPETKLRSVQRDLEELVLTDEVKRSSNGRYSRPLRATTLNSVEALALYSAARMLYHHAAEYNLHYLSALKKLTEQLPAPARRVALMANEAYRHKPNGQASRTFELVAQAWLEGRVLRAQYHSVTRISEIELVIYFIEVNARNREAYAIGHNRLGDSPDPRVYRLSRMRNSYLLSDECKIPEQFHPLEYLSNAWGIMTGPPTRVELFFTPEMKDRVAEMPLGLQAEVVVLSSGHTRVVLTVGGWKELVPWILGWGAEVEVVAPADLRSHLSEVALKFSQVYHTPSRPVAQL
ncbi:helix-turn-helix transcriptional regulator [Deinococcus aerophilus]|uniref:DNA-binding protein n=1 Tax=Deinococcus aerophilus TaxID=522488 RepID=A0ABQ2GY41_9DEIO|nr:WYL domain-containing protein [Deinococcus aerophilus]GGM17244.1 DNA-binding protein [Deinococcus aerophilus]